MASIPGYCEHCGAVFDGAGLISITGSSNIRIRGNRTNCPRCGRIARLVDGVFAERGLGLEVQSGPPLTHAIVDQLREISRKVNAREISAAEAALQAESIDPIFGRIYKHFLALGLPSLGILIALIGLYLLFEDRRSSAEFERDLMREMTRQSAAIEQLVSLEEKDNDGSVYEKRADPAAPKTGPKAAAAKPPSDRRAFVKNARREELRRYREMFVPRPRPKPTTDS